MKLTEEELNLIIQSLQSGLQNNDILNEYQSLASGIIFKLQHQLKSLEDKHDN